MTSSQHSLYLIASPPWPLGRDGGKRLPKLRSCKGMRPTAAPPPPRAQSSAAPAHCQQSSRRAGDLNRRSASGFTLRPHRPPSNHALSKQHQEHHVHCCSRSNHEAYVLVCPSYSCLASSSPDNPTAMTIMHYQQAECDLQYFCTQLLPLSLDLINLKCARVECPMTPGCLRGRQHNKNEKLN